MVFGFGDWGGVLSVDDGESFGESFGVEFGFEFMGKFFGTSHNFSAGWMGEHFVGGLGDDDELVVG